MIKWPFCFWCTDKKECRSDRSVQSSQGKSQTCLYGWAGFFTNHFQEISCIIHWPVPMLATLPQRQYVHCPMKGSWPPGFALQRVWQWVKGKETDPLHHSFEVTLFPTLRDTAHTHASDPGTQGVMQVKNSLEVFCSPLFPLKHLPGNQYLRWMLSLSKLNLLYLCPLCPTFMS